MDKKNYDTMKLSRLIGRSWTFAKALCAGDSRPDFGSATILREVARIPFDAWVMPNEVIAAKARAA